MWTGKFDLNTLRVDGNIFEHGKKKLQIQEYPDTCGRRKSAIKSVSEDKRKIPHTVFGVVQSSIRTDNLEAIC